MSKIFLVLLLLLLVTSATWIPGVPFRTASARDLASVRGDGNDPYLELSITPSLANVGTLVTLQITYHNIGEPYLYLSIVPAENVEYAAEVPGNCDYSVRSNACSISILRTLKTGVVTFRASATGEILDEGCQCWVWSVAFDNGPAILHIGNLVYLPLVQRRLQPFDLQHVGHVFYVTTAVGSGTPPPNAVLSGVWGRLGGGLFPRP